MNYSDENHFALFHLIAASAGHKVIQNKGYQYYYIEGFIWPNLIFGAPFHEENALDILNPIHEKMATDALPNLLICSPPNMPKSGINFLQKHYKKHGHWTAMHIALDLPIAQVKIADFTVKKAVTEKEIQEWCEVLALSNHGKYIDQHLFYTMAQQENCYFYTGYIKGKAVATCWAHHYNGSLGLYAITTDSKYTGKGIASEITRHAMRIAQEEKLHGAFLQATNAAISLYQKLGFNTAGTLDVFDLKHKI